jgi:hypothetical protein
MEPSSEPSMRRKVTKFAPLSAAAIFVAQPRFVASSIAARAAAWAQCVDILMDVRDGLRADNVEVELRFDDFRFSGGNYIHDVPSRRRVAGLNLLTRPGERKVGQVRLYAREQTHHPLAVAAVSADQAMLAHEPDIACASHRGGRLRNFFFLGLAGIREFGQLVVSEDVGQILGLAEVILHDRRYRFRDPA